MNAPLPYPFPKTGQIKSREITGAIEIAPQKILHSTQAKVDGAFSGGWFPPQKEGS